MEPLSNSQRAYRALYAWACSRLYHELAWGYEIVASVVSLGRWGAWRRQALDHVAGGRVLELGFGTGALLETAAVRGIPIVGLDPSPEMHRAAERRTDRINRQVPRVLAVAQRLPFANGTFGTVISTFPTGYVYDLTTIDEVRRVVSCSAEGGSPGRWVILGLGYRIDQPWLRRLLRLVFPGPDTDGVTCYAEWVTELGIQATVVDDGTGPVRVPVLILQWPLSPGEA